jgi:hypothetical protein
MLHVGQVVSTHRKRGRIDLLPMRVGELQPFAHPVFERASHRLIAGFVHQPIEVEGGHEPVRAIREHAAVRIELRIDDGDIAGMVTLFYEEERVVFADVPDITGERVVQRNGLYQNEQYDKESHCSLRPFMSRSREVRGETGYQPNS